MFNYAQFIINRFSPLSAVTSKLAVGVLLVTKPNHFFRQTLAQISRPPIILQFSIFSTAQSPHTQLVFKATFASSHRSNDKNCKNALKTMRRRFRSQLFYYVYRCFCSGLLTMSSSLMEYEHHLRHPRNDVHFHFQLSTARNWSIISNASRLPQFFPCGFINAKNLL